MPMPSVVKKDSVMHRLLENKVAVVTDAGRRHNKNHSKRFALLRLTPSISELSEPLIQCEGVQKDGLHEVQAIESILFGDAGM